MNALRSDESSSITKPVDPPTRTGAVDATNPFEAYDAKVASADLRKYRSNGPRPWTRALIEALKVEGVAGATLLDIGGGIGAIQHELLEAGAAKATSVEASSAYLSAARAETHRLGHTGRVTYQYGDFVALAESIPPADVVTLERVLNVYPNWEQLAVLSAERARRLYGVVIPRDTTFVRLVISVINLALRLRRQRVRAAVVPIDALERILLDQGLHQSFSGNVGRAWRVLLYRRD
jgi:2-polyprenyl-3-methyl-5-hydroxy-6-metoxy-1,4-benzoquinol methylase